MKTDIGNGAVQLGYFWCVAANVRATGAKAWCLPLGYSPSEKSSLIIGILIRLQNRSILEMVIPSDRLTNWRVQEVHEKRLKKAFAGRQGESSRHCAEEMVDFMKKQEADRGPA